LLWVLITLLDWQIVMYEICVRPLTDQEKEVFYSYHRRVCLVWGISPRLLPLDWKSFMHRCYRTFASDQLTVTDAARDMSTFLMQPPQWERLIGWYTLEMVTSVLLPRRIREAYRLRYGHREVWGTVAFFAAIKMAYRILPRSFRSFTSYMLWQQRVTKSTSLSFISQFASWCGSTFMRLYFGKHQIAALNDTNGNKGVSPITTNSSSPPNATVASKCPF
jgi:uncharacterized protein (DUF2236 family)